MDYDLYGWAQGKQRMATIKALSHAMTPTQTQQAAKQLNPKISLNNTCDILKDFVRKGIAQCQNPQTKNGKIYRLTQTGEEIRQEMIKG